MRGSDRPTRTCDPIRRPGTARDSRTSRARLLRSGLHAAAAATAEVAGVTDPVVVVSSGTRACPLGVRCQQRVDPLSGTAPPPGRNTTHERTDPSEHLFSPCDAAVPRSHGQPSTASLPEASLWPRAAASIPARSGLEQNTPQVSAHRPPALLTALLPAALHQWHIQPRPSAVSRPSSDIVAWAGREP